MKVPSTKHLGRFVLLAALSLAPLAALAQVSTGSLAGTVTDSTGGVIPNAQLTATEKESGTVYKTTTSSSGSYVFPSLRPGSYTLDVASPSFKTLDVSDIIVSIATRASRDAQLSAGGSTETVNVVANGPSLETETSDIGTVLSPEQVLDLPLAAGGFRSLQALSFLVPGAVGPGTNGGTFQSKIAGGQTLGSEYLVDGVSTYRSENGSGNVDQTTPSVDSIEEIRVETSSLPADFGRTTGGIANYKTRAGTNSYHGHVYDFYKNKVLDANNWFNNGYIAQQGGTLAAQKQFQRPPDTKNDYGVTLGGPAVIPHIYNGRDKTFFFFNFEQNHYNTGGIAATTVPTQAQRNGDFSAFLGTTSTTVNPCTGQPLVNGQLFDPASGTTTVGGVDCRSTAFANNQIPTSRFDPTSLKILAYIPLPTPGYMGTGTNNYQQAFVSVTGQTVYSIRVDQNLGTRSKLFFFGSARENSNNGTPNLPEPIDTNATVTDQFYKYGRLGWDFTLTPHVVNSLVLGGNRVNSFNASQAALSGTNFDALLGIPNSGGASTTFPSISFGEPQSLTAGNSNNDNNHDNALIINEVLNVQKGRHSVRFGGLARYQQFSYNNNGTASGAFNFSRAQTAGSSNSGPITGNGFASFLLGATSDINRTIQTHAPRWIQPYYGAFVQDDWKVRPNLTLNLGLRYTIDSPRYEATGASSNFDANGTNTAAGGLKGVLAFSGNGTGRNGNKHETWANTYFKNFEPRVGFAYSPGWLHNTVALRGAYTIISGPLEYADYGQGLTAGFTQGHDHNTGSIRPFSQFAAGFPATDQYVVNTSPFQRNGQQIDAILPDMGRPSTIQNWSLETQTQLAPDLIFTLGYIGQHSVRLRGYVYEQNNLPLAYFGLGDNLNAQVDSPTAAAVGVKEPYPGYAAYYRSVGGNPTVAQALAPFPQFGFMSSDNYLQNRGQASYSALEAKLERRFRNGLNVLASYTWSKTMTDADSIQPFFATLLGQGGTQNPYNLKAEKAVSNQDVPNNFVVSYLYELPVGKGKKFLGNSNRIVDTLIGGYRIGGIQRYLSGQPVSFFGGTTGPNGFYFGIRPNRVAGQPLLTANGKNGTYNPFGNTAGIFNKAAFADPNDPAIRKGGAYHFGNLSRNVTEFRTAASLNEDMSLNKAFIIHDNIHIDLRGEFFNIFNRHVFNKPDTGITDGNFGQIGSTLNGPRQGQVVLKIQY